MKRLETIKDFTDDELIEEYHKVLGRADVNNNNTQHYLFSLEEEMEFRDLR